MSNIWGSLGGINWLNELNLNKEYNKTHACIVVHRMARHNHLIDWYYLLSSFVKLMVIESLKSFTKYLHSIAYDKTSLPKSHEF